MVTVILLETHFMLCNHSKHGITDLPSLDCKNLNRL